MKPQGLPVLMTESRGSPAYLLMFGLSYSSMLILLPPAPAPAPLPVELWLMDRCLSTPGVTRLVSHPRPLQKSSSELASLDGASSITSFTSSMRS